MPPATPEGALATALAGLTADLPSADAVTVDVVGLRPRHCDPERNLSRAKVTVLVTAPDAPEHVVDALLTLQAKATYEIDEIEGPAWWTALGRTPQAAFLVTLDVTRDLPTRDVPIVLHPLEALTFDRNHHTRPDAPAPA
jgi:hypothetical protein